MITVTLSHEQKEEGKREASHFVLPDVLEIWHSSAFSGVSCCFFHSCCQNGLGQECTGFVCPQLHYISGFLHLLFSSFPGSFHDQTLPNDSWFSAFQIFFFLVPWAKFAEEPCALGNWMLSLSSFPILGKTLLVSLFEYLPQSSLGDLRPPISPLLHPWWFLK